MSMASAQQKNATGRRIATVAMTFATLLLAVGLVAVFSLMIAKRANSVEPPQPTSDLLVQTQIAVLRDSYSVERAFFGQIEAARTAALSFENGGTLAEILVNEGDIVTRGTVVARLDTRRLEAERDRLTASLAAMEARTELARRTARRQEDLASSGFASGQRVDETNFALIELSSNIMEVQALLTDLSVRLDKSVLRAPFDGQIGVRNFDDGMTIGGGVAVVSLLEDAAPMFRVGLSPALAQGLHPGATETVSINGADRSATVTAIRPDLDPATRTRTVLMELDGDTPPFRQSGTLTLQQIIAEPGFKLPISALREGVRGLWTVPVVEEAGDGALRIALASVEMIHASETTAFVRGTLTDGARVVVDGTHRLVAGQPVRIAPDVPASDKIAMRGLR